MDGDALEARLKGEEAEVKPKPKRPLRERAAQVFACLLTRENGLWGQKRIHEELRRMGVRVCARTIRKVLEEGGFSPGPRCKMNFDRFFSSAKDAIWALD